MDVLPVERLHRRPDRRVRLLVVLAVAHFSLGTAVLVTGDGLGGFSLDLPWVVLTLVAALLLHVGQRTAARVVTWWVLLQAVLMIAVLGLGLLHVLQAGVAVSVAGRRA